NPEVRRWLKGIEPAWTMLEFDSYNALHHEPAADGQAIRLDPNLTATDLPGSPVISTAAILLRRAADARGLTLTVPVNLSRAVVAEMTKIVEWPDFDNHQMFAFNKVINETDFLPVHFVRLLAHETKLLRTQKGKLVLTRLGKQMLASEQLGAFQALLFHIALW